MKSIRIGADALEGAAISKNNDSSTLGVILHVEIFGGATLLVAAEADTSPATSSWWYTVSAEPADMDFLVVMLDRAKIGFEKVVPKLMRFSIIDVLRAGGTLEGQPGNKVTVNVLLRNMYGETVVFKSAYYDDHTLFRSSDQKGDSAFRAAAMSNGLTLTDTTTPAGGDDA